MLKYALRYAPLLILALLLVPLHIYIEGNTQAVGTSEQYPAFPPYVVAWPFDHYSALYSIAALPSGEAWAVGGTFTLRPGTQGTRGVFVPSGGMILHYSDNAWSEGRVAEGQPQKSPLSQTNRSGCVTGVGAGLASALCLPLLGVSMDSLQDGWAVGWAGTLVHYNGNEWAIVSDSTNLNQNLLGVAMLSPSNGWAVGYSGTILHYDGKQWAQVPGPTTRDLRSIAMLSTGEGWAVGDSGTILHFFHGTWSIVSPSPTSSTLNSVTMLSTGEGWAVGDSGTILHYRNGIWESVHAASYYRDPSVYQPVDFAGVGMSSIRSGWIVGGQHLLAYSAEAWIEPGNIINSSNELYHGMTLSALNLYAIALSPLGEGWAVGSIEDYKASSSKSANAVVILHYQDGNWSVSLISG